jgi:hypothetical protein
MQRKKRDVWGVEEQSLGKNSLVLMQVSCSGMGTFHEIAVRLRAACLPWVGCSMLLLIIHSLQDPSQIAPRNAPSNPGKHIYLFYPAKCPAIAGQHDCNQQVLIDAPGSVEKANGKLANETPPYWPPGFQNTCSA